jgi:hypothetical protein
MERQRHFAGLQLGCAALAEVRALSEQVYWSARAGRLRGGQVARWKEAVVGPARAVLDRVAMDDTPPCSATNYLLHLAGHLLGSTTPVVPFRVKLSFKEPGCPGYGLHRDGDHWPVSVVGESWTVGIALSDTTTQHGPLMLPTTDGFAPCLLTAGSTVCFDASTPHWSAPNVSDTTRPLCFVSFRTTR